jgi:hypothetical protein
MAATLKKSAFLLTDYAILEKHFQWIIDGSIKVSVEKNLARELKFLKKYLLSLEREDLASIISEYATASQHLVDESGSTYQWVGVLRAAEHFWKTSDEHPLFRTELEGISGSSPQILFMTRNR